MHKTVTNQFLRAFLCTITEDQKIPQNISPHVLASLHQRNLKWNHKTRFRRHVDKCLHHSQSSSPLLRWAQSRLSQTYSPETRIVPFNNVPFPKWADNG